MKFNTHAIDSQAIDTQVIDTLVEAGQAAPLQGGAIARFGKITAVDGHREQVRIDFDGNPYPGDVSARLGRSFTYSELQLAVQNNLSCRIEFIGGDINLPIISDIFFSILGEKEAFVIKAKSIRIEAENELVVASGNTITQYSGRDDRVSTNAKYITSNAEKLQKIRGSTVSIN